jgi:hypothetical protein
MSTATPMDSVSRIEKYHKANQRYRLTSRQRRRVQHKHNRWLAPFDPATMHQHDRGPR